MSEVDSDSGDSREDMSYQSVKSECDTKSFMQSFANNNRFPLRPTINMALIILITFQVYIVVTSHMYLRGSLNRSFLQLYAQEEKYPDLYEGLAFYLKVRNVSQIRDGLIYTFEQMQEIDSNSFLKMDLEHAKITLSVQYLNNLQTKQPHKQFIIDPAVGIVEPFNMHKIEQIQKFLIQVNWFKLIVQNITVESEGFFQKYYHEVVYEYEQGLEVNIDFKFSIDNAMLNSMIVNKPQANYLFVIRGFYLLILLLAALSLYLNYRYIRRTMQVMFHELGKTPMSRDSLRKSMVNAQDMAEINQAVLKWIKINKLTPSRLTLRHYFYIIEFDILFSMISNIFTIVGSFYLFIGLQREIIIGISCLTSWMTIFKFLRARKKLVLMYELIKLSIVKVMFFFVEFFPVFLAYTFLGVCLFPKVSFYSSLAKSVTTLVSLMLGDSIQMITAAMQQKNSTILAVLYIFSFVLLFMHAIHNTLTSLIKEAFIFKKIQLIKEEKSQREQRDFLYISEIKTKADQEKDQLPIKLTSTLKKDLIRTNYLMQSNSFQIKIKRWAREWEKLFFREKWEIQENDTIISNVQYLDELKRRLHKINSFLVQFATKQPLSPLNTKPLQQQSLITNG